MTGPQHLPTDIQSQDASQQAQHVQLILNGSQHQDIDSSNPKQHITFRGLCVAIILGVTFCLITIKLNLGTAGMTPSLNIPGGLLSFVLLKLLSQLSSGMFRPPAGSTNHSSRQLQFTPQENAVVQTMTSACYNLAGYAGFGSYLLAMSYQVYLNLGGIPRDQPGFQEDAVIDPSMRRIYPYLLLIAFAGLFALLGFRHLLIIRWRLPYPSGAASGFMINSLHASNTDITTHNTSSSSSRSSSSASSLQVRVLGYSAVGSFLLNCLKWLIEGSDVSCGVASWPIPFGAKALRWTWHFDFQQQYIGAGMLVPHIVAWSMLLGAVISWGIMWPVLATYEGDWFPAGLDGSDLKGLGGYKIWLAVALLLGEGMYMLLRALILGVQHVRAAAGRVQGKDASADSSGSQSTSNLLQHVAPECCSSTSSSSKRDGLYLRQHGHQTHQPCYQQQQAQQTQQTRLSSANTGSSIAAAGAYADDTDESVFGAEDSNQAVAGVDFKETPYERSARERVFKSGHMPWWLGPAGYVICVVAGVTGIPFIYPPAKWFMVLVAFMLGPPIALANSVGAGLTDQDNGANYAVIALFLFASWAAGTGAGGGSVIAGCALMGVVMVFAVSAAVLMQDFRTAYITKTSPTSMFIGQVIGTGLGVACSPLVFYMFWQTGLVGVKGGPYPNPWADVSRGMAIIGTEGFSALPRYCAALSAVFFAAGLLLCLLRDSVPRKYGAYMPSPMGMAFSFYIGANNAIDFWLGSLIMLVWEKRNSQSAVQLGPLLGAGLIVGDGLWSVPSALLAIGGITPPLCVKF